MARARTSGTRHLGRLPTRMLVLAGVLLVVGAESRNTDQGSANGPALAPTAREGKPCQTRSVLRAKVRRPSGEWTEPLRPRVANRRIRAITRRQARAVERGEGGGLFGRRFVTVERERRVASVEQNRELVRCLSDAYALSFPRVDAIASCESGYDWRADSGTHGGTFQQSKSYWPERAAHYGHPGASIFDPYPNAHVSVQMMAEGGWHHWTCDPGAAA